MSAKIKSGDDVIVLTGRDKGKIGKVIRILIHNARKRAIVSGVNIYKRHVKPKAGDSGGILDKELTIDISNIAILDPKYKTSTRVGFKIVDGKKIRFAKVSGERIE
ncbi:MAG: 50S ribosomal protein L24 [Wolbachia pipientis]|nr:50S ribosomal protein L24 [Wolbachia pipientis]